MTRLQPVRRDRVGRPLRAHDPASTPLRPRFAEYLHAKRRSISARTRRNYTDAFELYCRWLALHSQPETIVSFDVGHLERYADYLRARSALPGHRPFDRARLSSFSQHAYLRPLNQLGDYMAWEGWIGINPFAETYDSLLPRIEFARRVIKRATPDDVRAVLGARAGDDPLALRDRAILLVGWETGMRTQDLCRLDLADLNLHTGLLTVRASKGDRDRQVCLGSLALPAVARYLGIGRPTQVDTASGRRAAPSGALFLSDAAGGMRNPAGRLRACE